jgi:hypothetical protein
MNTTSRAKGLDQDPDAKSLAIIGRSFPCSFASVHAYQLEHGWWISTGPGVSFSPVVERCCCVDDARERVKVLVCVEVAKLSC